MVDSLDIQIMPEEDEEKVYPDENYGNDVSSEIDPQHFMDYLFECLQTALSAGETQEIWQALVNLSVYQEQLADELQNLENFEDSIQGEFDSIHFI
jgi:hypothetical protein